jgi:hypothetical protein
MSTLATPHPLKLAGDMRSGGRIEFADRDEGLVSAMLFCVSS